MRNWLVFLLAFLGVVAMLYIGVDALSGNNARMGMFFTFVGSMTVVGLLIDVINHLRTRRIL